jgi:hypothetical protein
MAAPLIIMFPKQRIRVVERVSGYFLGEFKSWEEAYQFRDNQQVWSLAHGYNLNQFRYGVEV